MSKWTQPLPIWVSRETSEGLVAQFSVPLWLMLLIGCIILLNVLGWGVVGLVELVQYVL